MWFRWKKIENEYLIYLINFLYFLIEKVSRPCFMSMIITSVFPSPFLHRDLNFGFISVTDKVHCELFTYVHIRDERKRTQIWKQTRTQTKSWVRIHDFKFMVKQRLIGKARTRTLADFGHACTSISGRHQSMNTWTAETDIQINKFQKIFPKIPVSD